jgi:hypothetical protein
LFTPTPTLAKVKKKGIDPFLDFIENQTREFFKAKEFVQLYDLIFKMCIQRDPYNWSEQMYDRYYPPLRATTHHQISAN